MEAILLIISFLIAYLIGPKILPILRKLKFGQTVRDDGPQSHLQKNGTPTMGGIIFIIAILISGIIGIFLVPSSKRDILFALSFVLLFGLVGFIDDYIKVVKKRSLGLRAREKIIMQLVFATALGIFQMNTSALGTGIIVPFTSIVIDLGILYVPFLVFIIIALVNSVNLTDGLDGLASIVTVIVAAAFGCIASIMEYTGVSQFMAIVAGGCLGFLRVNKYPAKVFMGDTGSMALGGAVTAAAIILNLELLVPIICFVYFMESVSVILQVGSYKLTKKRIFKMAPIHHHFELCGWHETKVVKVFALITLLMGIVGVASVIIGGF